MRSSSRTRIVMAENESLSSWCFGETADEVVRTGGQSGTKSVDLRHTPSACEVSA